MESGAEKQYHIVAFMQNPWFKPGITQRQIELYRDNQHFHSMILRKSMSGKRLFQAFGDLYHDIWWDNANPEPVYHASGVREPNKFHMLAVLCKIRPTIVLSVGQQAYSGLQELDQMRHEVRMPNYVRFHMHHPNARGKTQWDLDQIARQVKEAYDELRVKS